MVHDETQWDYDEKKTWSTIIAQQEGISGNNADCAVEGMEPSTSSRQQLIKWAWDGTLSGLGA